MAEGIVSDARHRLLRTSNYTGLQIAAIALLNPVMIGKWKKKKERGTDHYAPSFSIVFYLKVIFLLSANPLSVWRLLPSAFINQTLQGHAGFQEKKKKMQKYLEKNKQETVIRACSSRLAVYPSSIRLPGQPCRSPPTLFFV